jgi:hypothetical protein
MAVGNTRDSSTAESTSKPVDYTNLNGTKDYVAPHTKAGVCAPDGQILITLKETPGYVKACYYAFAGVAKPRPAPAVAQASLPKSRTRTNPRNRDEASRNAYLHRGGFSREIQTEAGNASESEDDDLDCLTEDEAICSNALETYSEDESDSEVETVSSTKPTTLRKSLAREDKPLSDE